MIIAIDGPAGSGKSSISKLLAKELKMTYLDTGAMYRLFTLKVLKEKVSFDNLEEIKKLLNNLVINIEKDRFFLDNIDVTEEIRTPIVTENTSKVIAKIGEVREKMVDLQREFSKFKDIIVDGRDIGTIVFPNADLKIYLVADSKERAKRRYDELMQKNVEVSFEEIYENVLKRDEQDMNRDIAPLKKADDAIEVDTTGKTLEEVKSELIKIYNKNTKKNKILDDLK